MDISKLRQGVRIGVASTAALLMTTVAASAHVTARNDTTGSWSDNQTSVDVDNTTDVTVDNNADASNDFNADVTTGGNAADNNTGDSSTDTGDIMGDVSVESVLNGNATSFHLPSMGGTGSIESGNGTTGYNSNNDSSVNVDESTNLEVSNNGNVDNNIGGTFDSGYNSADNNTGDSKTRTGSLNVSGTVTNDVNANAGASLHAMGNDSQSVGNITAGNDTTGASSTNNSEVNVDKSLSISEENNANINNSVDFKMNTGDNTANNNTGDASIKTGSAKFNFKVKNLAN